jgi:hypothetical protein
MTFFDATLDDLDAVVDAMDRLATLGRGWINLVPAHVERHELASVRSIPGMIFGRFSGRGAPDPKITWTAPAQGRRRPAPAQLGIEHPAGPKARRQLDDAAHPIPVGWLVLQDHSLRGLVVTPAEGTSHRDQIRWAMRAAELLVRGERMVWQGQVFEG